MKTELTAEQSQHLISLGIPERFASMTANQLRGDPYYNDYYQEIFTLTDLLEILPKEIEIDNNSCNLNIQAYKSYIEIDYYTWADIEESICGSCYIGSPTFRNEELIDALYELTGWCIENGYLKFD